MGHNDLTFFTNEPDRNLHERFEKILSKNTQFFDALVGYFRTSGFYMLYQAMGDIEKIRILVGLNVDEKTIEIIHKSHEDSFINVLSHKEVKENFSNSVEKEYKDSEDSSNVENGVKTFISWLKSGKLEMRIYPESSIHAKVYIMRKDMNKVPDQFGSVITGSSNFSMAGLKNNLEFNVELKDSRDVEFALERFEELWKKSIDISSEYIETISQKTWIRDDITPYELYIKTLYEYFKEEINQDKNELVDDELPDWFMQLQYQKDAVLQAKKILDAYGGVFIADVVGLGKTFICAMIAKRLKGGKKLIICPPVLKDYWQKVLIDFDVAATVESLGKLDALIENGVNDYKYVFVDEAHRFRNENTESFAKLHEICFGKKVILISATPQNNYSSDIANQLYLFQPKNNSIIIPNNKNLQGFFAKLEGTLKKFDKGSPAYFDKLRANSEIIRDQVLRHVMIRRTRKEIINYYGEDLKRQGLKFPELGSPEKIVYSFDKRIEEVFNNTIRTIKNLDYARYAPLTYLKNIDKKFASLMVSQRNMSGFMKSILVKRLESSFYAFKKTLSRFVNSYELFIAMCEQGEVYISNKVDVYDLLDNGDDEKLMGLIDSEKVQHFSIKDFRDTFIPSLKRDLMLLKEIQEDWNTITIDPKIEQFLKELKCNTILKNTKLIIFTESKETAQYLGDRLNHVYADKVIVYSGESKNRTRIEIEANYNPRFSGERKDDITYLVTTDILAEGINLHRSNIIINYDLPWNPTKIMQRVGRINRVGTEHEKIYVFNFFPTAQTNAHLTLEENIIQKIQAFHDTLGEDFKYLSEDEHVTSHKLYSILNSKDGIEAEEDEENSELAYLSIIRAIRDNDINLFEKTKRLPQKSRSGRNYENIQKPSTITFLRKGFLKKFFMTDGESTQEVTFLEAMKYIRVNKEVCKIKAPEDYFVHLKLNKDAFDEALNIEDSLDNEKISKSGNDAKVIKLIKAISKCRTFTDDQEEMLQKLRVLWEEGEIPSTITKEVIKATTGIDDPTKVYYEIINRVPEKYFEQRHKQKISISGDRQVILSEYLQEGVDNN